MSVTLSCLLSCTKVTCYQIDIAVIFEWHIRVSNINKKKERKVYSIRREIQKYVRKNIDPYGLYLCYMKKKIFYVIWNEAKQK